MAAAASGSCEPVWPLQPRAGGGGWCLNLVIVLLIVRLLLNLDTTIVLVFTKFRQYPDTGIYQI